MVKNTKKYVSILMSAIVGLGSNVFVCKTSAAEANIDMANVKMLIGEIRYDVYRNSLYYLHN